ncbi:MAG TPA: hypothetical protein EYP35_10170 [Desulfobacterales bacterium]|nr:hypothetical protein [Desulfobacterales bacterium]HIP39923.1 hypothetical protein [Desulfocapsa sulfexigens]
MVKIQVYTKQDIKFDFNKHVDLILSVVPQNHLILLDKISFVDSYDKKIGCDQDGFGCYYFEKKSGTILINLSNLIKHRIPLYLLNYYVEIASLYLSEIIGHEIGHHVDRFWKHGTKDKERYAQKYAEVCYYNYFKKRKKTILLSYFLGEINILDFSKKDRLLFKERRKEHSQWFHDNESKFDLSGYP